MNRKAIEPTPTRHSLISMHVHGGDIHTHTQINVVLNTHMWETEA